ncbi:CMRF35-like molecule 8 [Colossoma macropomum]|uniref:CMRF35-like molecule 8 n=1 Tax=Colossoma macropomum TaxID=42526 RepID=UPI001863A06C|nr:CMRF35-like molecule 8 [Colossoma macropomum]
MKILLIFTFYLISGSVSCFDVIGYPGGNVVIYCKHKQYGLNAKYFCSKSSNQCVYLNQIPNTWSHTDRLSLCDSSEVLTVIYRNLSLQDAGSYRCGEAGVWSHDVNLKVNENPCCLGPKTVAGYLGETVTISCSYPEEFKTNYKYLLKQDGHDFNIVIDTTVTKRGRFSISDDRSSSVVSVRISDVREDDGGVYFCGVLNEGESVSYYSLYTETQLQVTASTAPTSVPHDEDHFRKSSYKPSSSVSIISLCVCVVLLLIGGSALIYYKMRHKKHQDADRSPGTQMEDNKEVDGDYENDQPTDLNHMSPVYQNSNTNQSDSVYQSLDPETKEPNSVYYSLKPSAD